jgi:peptidoglycan-associated lipoprotein
MGSCLLQSAEPGTRVVPADANASDRDLEEERFTMSRMRLLSIAILLLAVPLHYGCPKKPPATPEETLEVETAPVEPTTEVEAPTPPPMADMEEEGIPEDLAELNRVARERGYFDDVYFDFDKFDLRSEAREQLAHNAGWMRDNPALLFTIEGHCDERGTNEYNIALGQRRAAAAKDYIVSLGVEDARLRTISYGEERPFCTESDEACWQSNRRAHFVATGRR